MDDPRRPPSPTNDPTTSYRDVRVLVVGATGFVGRHVIAALVRGGAKLHWTTRGASQGAAAHGVDLRDEAAVRALIAKVRPAITFNLAGYGVDAGERNERDATLLNDELVGALARALAATPKSRDENWRGLELVHVGSALEYGDASGDLNEATEPKPTTLYGRTKLAGTRRLAELAATLPLRAATARLFMVYGPGEHAGRLLPSLIESARLQKPLPLTSGTQQRDFTFVGDAAEALLRLGVANGVRPGEAVNVATGRLTSVRDFVEAAARALKLPTELLQFGALPTRAEEMRHSPVAVARAKELLDWLPPTAIEEGLRKSAGPR
jgi:nucleoside-diphosphate-sugar epimerase